MPINSFLLERACGTLKQANMAMAAPTAPNGITQPPAAPPGAPPMASQPMPPVQSSMNKATGSTGPMAAPGAQQPMMQHTAAQRASQMVQQGPQQKQGK